MRPLLSLLLCAWLLWTKPVTCPNNHACFAATATPWRLDSAYETRKDCQAALKESRNPSRRCLPQGTYPEL